MKKSGIRKSKNPTISELSDGLGILGPVYLDVRAV